MPTETTVKAAARSTPSRSSLMWSSRNSKLSAYQVHFSGHFTAPPAALDLFSPGIEPSKS